MVVLGRSALAAVLLVPLALFRKEVMPVLRHWKPLLAYTIAEIVLPWFFLSSAEKDLSSSTAGLLIAAVPLVAVAVAFFMGRPAKLSGMNWVGILVGMLGVAAIVGLDVGGSNLGAVAKMIVVVVGYACGPAIISRWMPDLPGVGVTALSLAGAAIIYVPIVLFTGGLPKAVPSANVIVAVIVLAVVCSALAFIMLIALIGEVGPGARHRDHLHQPRGRHHRRRASAGGGHHHLDDHRLRSRARRLVPRHAAKACRRRSGPGQRGRCP